MRRGAAEDDGFAVQVHTVSLRLHLAEAEPRTECIPSRHTFRQREVGVVKVRIRRTPQVWCGPVEGCTHRRLPRGSFNNLVRNLRRTRNHARERQFSRRIGKVDDLCLIDEMRFGLQIGHHMGATKVARASKFKVHGSRNANRMFCQIPVNAVLPKMPPPVMPQGDNQRVRALLHVLRNIQSAAEIHHRLLRARQLSVHVNVEALADALQIQYHAIALPPALRRDKRIPVEVGVEIRQFPVEETAQVARERCLRPVRHPRDVHRLVPHDLLRSRRIPHQVESVRRNNRRADGRDFPRSVQHLNRPPLKDMPEQGFTRERSPLTLRHPRGTHQKCRAYESGYAYHPLPRFHSYLPNADDESPLLIPLVAPKIGERILL